MVGIAQARFQPILPARIRSWILKIARFSLAARQDR